jgi:hypothetical protein
VRSRAAVWVNFAFATIVVLAVFLQAYFTASWMADAGDGAREAHEVTGNWVVHPSEAIVAVSALIGFWGVWRWLGISVFLLVLGTVQIMLAPPEEDAWSGWVHGLHGLLAIVVLVVASVIAHHDMRLLRQRALPPAP